LDAGIRESKRQRERKRRKGDAGNRWCSQTILHRVLTVGKSIRDSRFDLYDQIPLGAIARERDREIYRETNKR